MLASERDGRTLLEKMKRPSDVRRETKHTTYTDLEKVLDLKLTFRHSTLDSVCSGNTDPNERRNIGLYDVRERDCEILAPTFFLLQ